MSTDSTYHHGDLPAVLRSASAELIAERGPAGFSLREVARRAGVSHAAPAHHFGTTTGLLTSVATEGYCLLTAAFDDAVAAVNDPVDRLAAMGKAYVSVALGHPGHFGVMCNKELIDTENSDFADASAASDTRLFEAIEAISAQHNPDLDIEAAAAMAWSAVHGLALLITSMPMVRRNEAEPALAAAELIDRFNILMLDGFAAR